MRISSIVLGILALSFSFSFSWLSAAEWAVAFYTPPQDRATISCNGQVIEPPSLPLYLPVLLPPHYRVRFFDKAKFNAEGLLDIGECVARFSSGESLKLPRFIKTSGAGVSRLSSGVENLTLLTVMADYESLKPSQNRGQKPEGKKTDAKKAKQ